MTAIERRKWADEETANLLGRVTAGADLAQQIAEALYKAATPEPIVPSVPIDQFVRTAHVVRIVDGDTLELRVDLGFRVEARLLIRVLGLNAPELPTAAGLQAKVRATNLLTTPVDGVLPTITIRSYKDRQSFERWLATVWINDVNMADLMAADVPAVR
jgi:micrococcal nuclease